jgi:hypothetical protein
MKISTTPAAANNAAAPAANDAAAIANNFNVTELEPRRENMWSGGRDDTSIEHAEPNTGRP